MKVRKDLLTANLIFGFVFFVCALFAQYKFFSSISLIFFVVYIIYWCVLKNKEFALKYLAFLFVSGAAVWGVAIIELFDPIYLVELDSSSSFVGSLPLIILGYWLFLCAIIFADSKYKFKIYRESVNELVKYKNLYNVISWIVLLLFLILFSKVASRSALQLGLDRFAYASQYSQLGILGKVVSNASLLIIFPILTIIYNNNFQRFIGVLGVVTYILYFAWTGNKFGPFLTLICIFLLVYYRKILEKGRGFLKRMIIVSFTSLGMIFAFAIIFSTSISSYSGLTYFEQRSAQQGQLWWKTYEICESTHPLEFADEIKAVNNGKDAISDNVGSNNGIYKIMYLCAPKTRVDFKLSTGSRYTEAGFATMYYYFGSVGVIVFSCVMGAIVAITVNFFIKALNTGDYVKSLIFLRFFLLERGAVSMFVFNDFVGVVSLLSYAYLLLMVGKKIALKKTGKFRLTIVKCQ